MKLVDLDIVTGYVVAGKTYAPEDVKIISAPGHRPTITVTWPDGTQETYACDSWEVDGQLWLIAPDIARVIPLSSIKIWTVS